jgi:hypothetical protein
MASLWADERAQKVIDLWDEDEWLFRATLKKLIAEAIDAAEEYGENRFKDTNELPEMAFNRF